MIEYSEGDKVRATHKETGEVHEFEVRSLIFRSLISTTGLYFYDTFWAFEKLTPPLPTKAGLYRPHKSDYNTRYLLLTTRGKWYWIDFQGYGENWPVTEIVPTSTAQLYAATITPIYLYGEE